MENAVMKKQKALPVREGLQLQYKIVRDKSIKEALLFAVFFSIFLAISLELWDGHEAFVQNAALQNAFINQDQKESTYYFPVGSVNVPSDMWAWLENVMYPTLWADTWDNGQPYSDTQMGYVLNSYRIVGPVRLRQVRVRNDSCSERRFLWLTAVHHNETLPRFDNKDGTCWADYGAFEQKENYGPEGLWQYETGMGVVQGLTGWGPSSYGTGGYVTYLSPDNRTHAWETLQQMRAAPWIDRGSRVIAAEFNLYNTNSKMVTVVQVLFEMYQNDYINQWSRFYSFRVNLYDAYLDQIRLVGELLFLGMWIYYFQKEARRMYWTQPKLAYFLKWGNAFESGTLAFGLATIYSWLLYTSDTRLQTFDVNSTTFIELFSVGLNFTELYSMVGFLCLLYSFKVFRYLSISKKMSSLWLTLAIASSDLLSFGIGFAVICLGFAVWGHFIYAYTLQAFYNVPTSFSTLMQTLLGVFNYPALVSAHPSLTAFYFGLFVALLFIVSLTMFIGIIMRAFEEVHEDARTADLWKLSAKSWEADVMLHTGRSLRKLRLRLARLCGSQTRPVVVLLHKTKEETVEATELEVEEEAARREALMMSKLHRCMQYAKKERNIDLFKYFENLYESEKDSDHMYVGIHELCTLTCKKPCAPDKHITCRAAAFITAYNEYKLVMIVGKCKEHVPVNLEVESGHHHTFEVNKLNRNGFSQERLLAIDVARGHLINMNRRLQVMKILPLRHAVQLEKSATDSRLLAVVFTSTGLKEADFDQIEDLETTYDIRFKDSAQRNEFVSLLLEGHSNAMAALNAPQAAGGKVELEALLRAQLRQFHMLDEAGKEDVKALQDLVTNMQTHVTALTAQITRLAEASGKRSAGAPHPSPL